ncbi:MAG TPA: hypothetical protein VFU45_06440 [Gemmatimonadales bacterium]|nr:hypothetical protein [Gemmatimonadales bacterium]
MRSKLVAALAFASVAFAAPAVAQVGGLPVFNAGIGTGIGINVDAGFPDSAAGKGHTYGLTGSVGLGPLGFTAIVASQKPEGASSSTTWAGATANLKLFGGPLVPVTVTGQVGVGGASPSSGTTLLNVPVSIGIAVNIPSPALSIKPWIAPRMQYTKISTPLGSTNSTKFGFSAGVNLGLSMGLGIRVAYDYYKPDTGAQSVFSVGAGYNIHVPGL